MTRRLWIKICGLRDREAIAAAAQAGADAVGFVFHEPSPRNVTPQQAAALRAEVPRGVETVAVFLHPPQALFDAAIAALQPDWVQTDLDDFARLSLPGGQRSLPVLRSGAARPQRLPERLLLEGAVSGQGCAADWTEAALLAAHTELVLGGGLDATNVAEAIRRARPYGVDVSSGVERGRGIKDPERIREFVAAARAAGSPGPG